MRLPLVTSYSNLQLRLGYLKIVAALGTRFPTTQQAFEDKLARLFPAPPPKKGHGLGLTAEKQTSSQSYIGQQFDRIGVRYGILNKSNVSEIVTLAKAFEFIDPKNCSLYEIAVVVQSVMGQRSMTEIIEQNATLYNPLTIGATEADFIEKALFTILILRSDLATALLGIALAGSTQPFHLYDCFPANSSPYSDRSLLLQTFKLIEESKKRLGSSALSLTNWKDWERYFQGDASPSPFGGNPEYRMGKRSSYRHHATPRLEFLVDLGLLQRETAQKQDDAQEGKSDFGYAYRATAATQRFSEYLKTNLLPNLDVEKFVRERAIDCFAKTHNMALNSATETETEKFLLKGFQEVKREIGSTPMWTTAFMSSLLALREKVRVEIKDSYDIAKKLSMAKASKVRLSGGSRFDGEFFISIAPDLLKPTTPRTP